MVEIGIAVDLFSLNPSFELVRQKGCCCIAFMKYCTVLVIIDHGIGVQDAGNRPLSLYRCSTINIKPCLFTTQKSDKNYNFQIDGASQYFDVHCMRNWSGHLLILVCSFQ